MRSRGITLTGMARFLVGDASPRSELLEEDEELLLLLLLLLPPLPLLVVFMLLVSRRSYLVLGQMGIRRLAAVHGSLP